MIRAAARGRADPKMHATRPATCDMRTTRCRVWPTIRDTIHDTQPTRNETLTHSDTIQNAQSKLTARYHDPPTPSSLARSTCGALERTYWNVGLFRYYELKQIPNFGLAAPALVLAGGAAVRFGAAALGPSRPAGATAGAALQSRLRLGAHAAHLAILALTCLLVANVQVGYMTGRVGVSISMVRLFKRGMLAVHSSAQLTTQHVRPSSFASCLSLWLMRSRRGFSRQRARCSSGTRRGSFEEEVRMTADGGHDRGRERQTEVRGRAAVRAGHGGLRCLRTTRSSGCSVWSFTRTSCRGLDWR